MKWQHKFQPFGNTVCIFFLKVESSIRRQNYKLACIRIVREYYICSIRWCQVPCETMTHNDEVKAYPDEEHDVLNYEAYWFRALALGKEAKHATNAKKSSIYGQHSDEGWRCKTIDPEPRNVCRFFTSFLRNFLTPISCRKAQTWLFVVWYKDKLQMMSKYVQSRKDRFSSESIEFRFI